MERLRDWWERAVEFFTGPFAYEDASDLDALTAEQERNNPDYDYESRVATCRDALSRKVLSLEEAKTAFGDSVVAEALKGA